MASRPASWKRRADSQRARARPDVLVHPNTVARAFQELERAGVVTARRGVGMEVTDGARALCRAKRRDIIPDAHPPALREAVASA